MKTKIIALTVIFILPFLLGSTMVTDYWDSEKHKDYKLFYTAADKQNKKEYRKLIKNGIKSTSKFFHGTYKNDFAVYIHPNKKSLDSTWQKNWEMPNFKSECWMVASGVADRLDMISPKFWKKESCEHDYANSIKTQRLITHELIHVYHGQHNPSPDFSDTENMDWFVEGLATYASGQCDLERINEIKKLISEKKAPERLDKFWTGKSKYGLSGSIVMFIDVKYGRTKLTSLLKFNKSSEVLTALNTTEKDLVNDWKVFIAKQ